MDMIEKVKCSLHAKQKKKDCIVCGKCICCLPTRRCTSPDKHIIVQSRESTPKTIEVHSMIQTPSISEYKTKKLYTYDFTDEPEDVSENLQMEFPKSKIIQLLDVLNLDNDSLHIPILGFDTQILKDVVLVPSDE